MYTEKDEKKIRELREVLDSIACAAARLSRKLACIQAQMEFSQFKSDSKKADEPPVSIS